MGKERAGRESLTGQGWFRLGTTSITRTTSQHQTGRFTARLRLKPEIKQSGYGQHQLFRPGPGERDKEIQLRTWRQTIFNVVPNGIAGK